MLQQSPTFPSSTSTAAQIATQSLGFSEVLLDEVVDSEVLVISDVAESDVEDIIVVVERVVRVVEAVVSVEF